MGRVGIPRTRHFRYRTRFARFSTFVDWLTRRKAVSASGGLGDTAASNSISSYSNATNQINSTAHGLVTGDGPIQLFNSGGAAPAELSTGVDYWVTVLNANAFTVNASREGAEKGVALAFTDDGTGTHTWERSDDTDQSFTSRLRNGVKPETIDASTDIDTLTFRA